MDGMDRRTDRRIVAAISLVATVAATSVFVIARPDLEPVTAVVLVLVAFTAWGVAVVATREARSARAAAIVGLLAGTTIVAALLVPPRGSHDLWGYAVYGRMVSQHGVSPYTHDPAEFPHDPLLPLMGSGYHHTRSPYGPAFTAVSALGTGLVGADPRANRLVFQGLEALAVAIVLVVLWRRTRRVDALVWVGLNPVVISALVNDGHNDGLIMLCILLGIVLTTDRRAIAGAAVLGLAALVKLPALLALAGLTIWLLRARGLRESARAAAVGAGVVVLGYAFVGPAAVRSISESGQVISRASVWTPVRDLLSGGGHSSVVDALPVVALVGVVALAALLAYAGASDAEPVASTAGASSAFALGGSYVLPWYATWGLPSFALRRPGALAWLVAAQGALLLVTYQLPHHADAVENGLFVHRLLTDVVPTAIVVAAVVIGVRALTRSRDTCTRLRFVRDRRSLARAHRAGPTREPRPSA